MTPFTVFVPGVPRSKGSWTPVPVGISRKVFMNSSSKRSPEWQARVSSFVSQEWKGDPINSSIGLYLNFVFERPKSHYHKNGSLKASSPKIHEKKIDLDKLSRSVMDALTKVSYRDDSQVVFLVVAKSYGQRDGVQITIREPPDVIYSSET